jgi:signal transduction histidine kinase
MRFRWRLAIFGAGITALVVLVFGGLIIAAARNAAPQNQFDQLQATADALAAELNGAPRAALTADPGFGRVDVGEHLDPAFLIIENGGQVIGGTAYTDDGLLDLPVGQRQPTGEFNLVTYGSSGLELRGRGASFSSAAGATMTVLVVQRTDATDRDLEGLQAVTWLAAIITFLVALIASWIISGRALRPLRTLADTADEIRTTGDLSRRLPDVKSKDELGRITNSFNSMVADLETSQAETTAALTAQRRFVADASHELRSPLTTIRNNAEFLAARDDITAEDRSEAVADISAEANRMAGLVDDLLALARGESLERRERIDVGVLIESEAERLRRDGTAVDVHIERAAVIGDPAALERLLRILTTNARHHGAPPLTLRCGVRRGNVFLGVADRGEGFPTDDVVQVFDRFYRADRARDRTGSGLGLAIANQIATTHGGRMVAANQPGGGAVVEVEIPPAP